jgi:L-alanine-DL-glutamate epimerase-like enolase superfamily enzyme
MRRRLSLAMERWPTRGAFTISRGAVDAVEVVTVTLAAGGAEGRGECRPYARYGERAEATLAELDALRPAIEEGEDAAVLLRRLKAGAARNALDSALLDLEAKRTGQRVWQSLGLPEPTPVLTAFTLSLGPPEAMAAAARAAADRPLLKLKLGGEGDVARVAAVRAAVPAARLIVDANEAWTPRQLARDLPALADLGVELVEQPLPAGADAALGAVSHAVPICADESCHAREGLEDLVGCYDLVNVKLDKTGGLREAVATARQAQRLGFGLMVGCMVGTSLAIAPALLLAGLAGYADLDGPLLLERDREPGLVFTGSLIQPPEPALWG